MTNRTADQQPALESTPQEQRLIIFCIPCNSFVASVNATKLDKVLGKLNQGPHQGHEFRINTTDELYGSSMSDQVIRTSREHNDQITADSGGIRIY